MTNVERVDLALLGARGIGAVHARVIHHVGATVSAVLGRDEDSAKGAAEHLRSAYGFQPRPYARLDDLIREERPHGAVIATPTECHFEQLMMLGRANVPVFCEKPLIHAAGLSAEAACRMMDALRFHRAMPYFLNVSNSYFFSDFRQELSARKIDRMMFSFHTKGRNRGESIAWDLLPHGFSVLNAIGIQGEVSPVRHVIQKQLYRAEFRMNDVDVVFDFRQGDCIDKQLSLEVNSDVRLERVQKGQGQTYRVFIRDSRGPLYEKEDPFVCAMRDFVRRLKGEPVSNVCCMSDFNMQQVVNFSTRFEMLS